MAYYYHKSENHSISYTFNYEAGCEAYARGDIDDSIACFQRAIDDAEIMQNDGLKMEVNWRLGRAYAELGMAKEACDLYMIPIIYYISGNKQYSAYISKEIASIYKNKGDYDTALNLYTVSLNLAKELNNQHEISMRLHDIGQIYQYRGDYNKALEFFGRSMGIRRSIQDRPGCAWGLYELGVTYRLLGDYCNALENLEESQRFFEELGDKRGLAWASHAKGYLYYRTTNPDRTLEFYEMSLDIYKKASEDGSLNYLDKASVLHDIGEVCLNQGNPDQAMSNFEEALRIRRALGDKIGISRTLEYMAKTYRLKEDNNKSISLYNECLEIKERLRDMRGMARVYNGLARNYIDLGDRERARDFFQKNFEISEKIKNTRGRALALYGQALICIAEKDLDRALELLYRCEKLQMGLHERLEIAETYTELGHVHLELGNKDEARRYFNDAISIFKMLKAENRLYKINRYLEALGIVLD
ncbi:MAG: tetratricopeptide repeat protein [Methanothrix sp.]|nr:MAG: tetratricopeptide repeat protein [Methanothrix sp.]